MADGPQMEDGNVGYAVWRIAEGEKEQREGWDGGNSI
jgi:hypothetical protein